MLHPSVHLEIARQRQEELLALGERRRSAQAAVARSEGNRVRSLIARLARHVPFSVTSARHPRRAEA